ncbi:MAG: gamma-glutamylcyclotransferase, partial [Pseudomonadota bacterium]
VISTVAAIEQLGFRDAQLHRLAAMLKEHAHPLTEEAPKI